MKTLFFFQQAEKLPTFNYICSVYFYTCNEMFLVQAIALSTINAEFISSQDLNQPVAVKLILRFPHPVIPTLNIRGRNNTLRNGKNNPFLSSYREAHPPSSITSWHDDPQMLTPAALLDA